MLHISAPKPHDDIYDLEIADKANDAEKQERALQTLDNNYDHKITDKTFDVKKQGRAAGWRFNKYLRDQVLRYASANCRRTDGWSCSNSRSPFTTRCGDFCVNGGTLGCVRLVLDIAVASFDIVSNFIPFGKVFTAVKMANKARKLKKTGDKACRAAKEVCNIHLTH